MNNDFNSQLSLGHNAVGIVLVKCFSRSKYPRPADELILHDQEILLRLMKLYQYCTTALDSVLYYSLALVIVH